MLPHQIGLFVPLLALILRHNPVWGPQTLLITHSPDLIRKNNFQQYKTLWREIYEEGVVGSWRSWEHLSVIVPNLLMGDLARASHLFREAWEPALPEEGKLASCRDRTWWGRELGISPRLLVQMCAVPECSAEAISWDYRDDQQMLLARVDSAHFLHPPE